MNTLKYLTNWYADAVKKNPGMVDKYEKQSDKYVEETDSYFEKTNYLSYVQVLMQDHKGKNYF